MSLLGLFGCGGLVDSKQDPVTNDLPSGDNNAFCRLGITDSPQKASRIQTRTDGLQT